ncbi:MAG TPA: AraC family transcriptional regulator [Candidatus Acidoferrum sp.]|nr:AraC family transcriptional regulator [Candidatus Acidoferrum sp.]
MSGSASTTSFLDRSSQILPSELIGSTEHLRLSLISDEPGRVEFSGSPRLILSLHVGPTVYADCRRAGEHHGGSATHGDIEIIPPNLAGVWEIRSRDTALVIALKMDLLRAVVEQAGGDPSKLRIRNRFQVRDLQIEHLGWALKAEMESGYPCGRVYTDSLAVALAARIVQNHSSMARPARSPKAFLPPRKLKSILAFIEDNLCRDISLLEIARAADLSVSHFKSSFRKSLGVPPHQYLIRRRVERAAHQLRHEKTPIGQIALENGFCHQSHLALHTRRVLGVTPQELRENS